MKTLTRVFFVFFGLAGKAIGEVHVPIETLFAQPEAAATESLFCSHPVEYVCAGTDDPHEIKTRFPAARLEARSTALSGEGVIASQQKLLSPFVNPETEAATADSLQHNAGRGTTDDFRVDQPNILRLYRAYRAYAEALESDLGIDSAYLAEVSAQVKENLRSSLASVTSFSEEQRAAMEQGLERIVVYTPSSLAVRMDEIYSDLPPQVAAAMWFDAVLGSCTQDLLTSQAANRFYMVDRGNGPEKFEFVLICPGAQLRANLEDNQAAIPHLIGHETSHALDIRSSPKGIYADFEACAFAKYKPLWDAEGRNFPDKLTNEAVTDWWTAEDLIRRMGQLGLEGEEKYEYVRDSLVRLCGTAQRGTHFSGAFRIGVIFGNNPSLREFLGCAPQTEPLFCSLE